MPPQGDKSSYSGKQKRQARHIEDSELESGRSRKSAERIAWATVNKHDGGAKGRKRSSRSASRSSRSVSKKRSSSRPARTRRH